MDSKKFLISITWNLLYSFVYFLADSKWTLPHDPWTSHFFTAGVFTIISIIVGLLFYGMPLLFLCAERRRKRRKKALLYILMISTLLVVGGSCLFLPGVLAVISLTAGEYQYTPTERLYALLDGLLELIGFHLGYIGSYLGYFWVCWRTDNP